MPRNKKTTFIASTLFEEDYLIRTLGPLAHSPEIALTELVANAWDAGATSVDITIPEDYNQRIIIEDNGTGLSREQFEQRWMKLGYNRLKHQGKNVIFPPGITGKRMAYGRNGVGRHGLLCFGKEYTVTTNSCGEKSTFTITTQSETQPFVIKDAKFEKSNKYGTKLEVIVNKNLPKANKILEIISARFLHDPNFIVSINKQNVHLEDHSGLINSSEIKVGKTTMLAHFIDSQKSARTTLHQGIAFWQSNRLVGDPSWILGNEAVIDGRTKFAKRYTVVVKTKDLAEHILEDWTGFKRTETISKVFTEVSSYVNKMFSEIAKDSIEDTKLQIKSEFHQEISRLTPLARYEVNEAIESISLSHPTARPESITLAVEAIIKLEGTRTGKELLTKLTKLNEEDISGLNTLLEKWSIKDALCVLDEIDRRLSIIEAIRKLSNDKETDELHILHPLVTNARWLFGPEFESAEYASNRQLQTASTEIFKKKIGKEVFLNHKKRPDIVVLQNSTISVTGTEAFQVQTNLSTVNKILLIELKRGQFKLTREERNQAQGYVEDFMNCGSLIGNPYIDAFVVGSSFSDKAQPTITVKNGNGVEMGQVNITTFSQLVDTAERRLFKLREKLNDRYDDVSGIELFRRQNSQLEVDFKRSGTDG